MLHEFLLRNQTEILQLAENKSLQLAGARPSSDQLKRGLPVFYEQLTEVLRFKSPDKPHNVIDVSAIAKALDDLDESALAKASGRPDEANLAATAGLHGKELQRLGYTLSHVVHTYGAMCQSITELALTKKMQITIDEFHDLNGCLDVAIAGAVTEYQSQRSFEDKKREIEHLGFLAHELRNALTTVNMSLQMIKKGTVGFGGSTGFVLDNGLRRLEVLVDRSMTEVRLRVDPKPHAEHGFLLHIVDQIVVTAEIEARQRSQILEIQVDPNLIILVDQQLFYSALSNLIQNAIKYTRIGGKIQVRGNAKGNEVLVEVEDECGGLSDKAIDLFKPFEQQHENREGLGLGLAIAKRAIILNHGALEVQNLPTKGCVFKITLPNI